MGARTVKHGETGGRRDALIAAAARRLAARGYEGTPIRDIAKDVGMLPGSIYYHFKSKEELVIAVHAKGVALAMEAVQGAVQKAGTDPWACLTAAAEAHLEVLLGDNDFSRVVTPQFTENFGEPLRSTLIAQRNEYESCFVGLMDRLPLPAGVNRQLFRLSLLGSLNWTLTWHHPGRMKPATLARQMIDLYRKPLDITQKLKREPGNS